MSNYKSGDFIVWARRWSIHCGKVLRVYPSSDLQVHEYHPIEKTELYWVTNLGKQPILRRVITSKIIKVEKL